MVFEGPKSWYSLLPVAFVGVILREWGFCHHFVHSHSLLQSVRQARLPAQNVGAIARPDESVQPLELPQPRVDDSGHGDPLPCRPEGQVAGGGHVPTSGHRGSLHHQPDLALRDLDWEEGLVLG